MPAPNAGEISVNVLPVYPSSVWERQAIEQRRKIEKVFGGLNIGKSLPLGRITAQVSDFDKSLASANARVIAFGAAAGVFTGVISSIGAMIRETIKLDGALTDINVLFNKSQESLSKFRDSLFDVAKISGQPFTAVADAAKEFARQGLNAEETLKRTQAALVLVRLSGLDTQKAVESLTATLNSFVEFGGDATKVVDKLAAVDSRFAVSTRDLAEALSRAGNSAQDAGVQFDEFLGLVTAIQQRTARGGAVIGNALKTIFSRTGRNETLDQLEQIGVAVKDVQGNLLPALDILNQVSDKLNSLPQAQKSSVEQLLGGVYQINVLKAGLKDLADQNSVVARAAAASANAQGEALQRNAELNKSLQAQANAALVSIQKVGAVLGKDIFGPVLENVFGRLTEIGDIFNENDGEQIGEKVARGIAKGIGNVLSGPGFALGAILAGKLTTEFARYIGGAGIKELGIGGPSQGVLDVQKQIELILNQNKALTDQIGTGELTQLEINQKIVSALEQQVVLNTRNAQIIREAAVAASQAGISVAPISNQLRSRSVNRAGGNLPISSIPPEAIAREVAGAKQAGYSIAPSNVRAMRATIKGQPTTVVYNNKETVVHDFMGSGEPLIVPPTGKIKNYPDGYLGKLGPKDYPFEKLPRTLRAISNARELGVDAFGLKRKDIAKIMLSGVGDVNGAYYPDANSIKVYQGTLANALRKKGFFTQDEFDFQIGSTAAHEIFHNIYTKTKNPKDVFSELVSGAENPSSFFIPKNKKEAIEFIRARYGGSKNIGGYSSFATEETLALQFPRLLRNISGYAGGYINAAKGYSFNENDIQNASRGELQRIAAELGIDTSKPEYKENPNKRRLLLSVYKKSAAGGRRLYYDTTSPLNPAKSALEAAQPNISLAKVSENIQAGISQRRAAKEQAFTDLQNTIQARVESFVAKIQNQSTPKFITPVDSEGNRRLLPPFPTGPIVPSPIDSSNLERTNYRGTTISDIRFQQNLALEQGKIRRRNELRKRQAGPYPVDRRTRPLFGNIDLIPADTLSAYNNSALRPPQPGEPFYDEYKRFSELEARQLGRSPRERLKDFAGGLRSNIAKSFSYQSESAQRRAGTAATAGIGISFIGGAFAQTKNEQFNRRLTGVSAGIGTAATLASFGPAGAVVGGLLGSFQALKAVVDNLTPSVEDLQQKFAKENERREQTVQAGGQVAQLTQQIQNPNISDSERSRLQKQRLSILYGRDSGGNVLFKSKDINSILSSKDPLQSIFDLNDRRSSNQAAKAASARAEQIGVGQIRESTGIVSYLANNFLTKGVSKLLGVQNNGVDVEKFFGSTGGVASNLAASIDFQSLDKEKRQKVLQGLRDLRGGDASVSLDKLGFKDGDKALKSISQVAEKRGVSQSSIQQYLQNVLTDLDVELSNLGKNIDKTSKLANEWSRVLENSSERLNKNAAAQKKINDLQNQIQTRTAVFSNQKALSQIGFDGASAGARSLIDLNNSQLGVSGTALANSRISQNGILQELLQNKLENRVTRANEETELKAKAIALSREISKNVGSVSELDRNKINNAQSIIGGNSGIGKTLQALNQLVNTAFQDTESRTKNEQLVQNAEELNAAFEKTKKTFDFNNNALEEKANAELRQIKITEELTRGFAGLESLLGRFSPAKSLVGQGPDLSAFNSGVNAQINRSLRENDPDFQKRLRQSQIGSSRNVLSREIARGQQRAIETQTIGRGILSGFESGFIPTQNDINGMNPNSPLYQSALSANQKGRADLTAALTTQSNLDIVNGLKNSGLSGFADKGGLASRLLQGTNRALQNGFGTDFNNALNIGDTSKLRELIQSVQRVTPSNRQGAFGPLFSALNNADLNRALAPQRIARDVISAAGGDNKPLDIKSYKEGIDKLIGVLKPETISQYNSEIGPTIPNVPIAPQGYRTLPLAPSSIGLDLNSNSNSSFSFTGGSLAFDGISSYIERKNLGGLYSQLASPDKLDNGGPIAPFAANNSFIEANKFINEASKDNIITSTEKNDLAILFKDLFKYLDASKNETINRFNKDVINQNPEGAQINSKGEYQITVNGQTLVGANSEELKQKLQPLVNDLIADLLYAQKQLEERQEALEQGRAPQPISR